MNHKNETWINIILSLILSSYVTLVLGSSFFNRYSSDDYLIISQLREKSVLNYANEMYESWSGRYVVYLLYFGLIKYFEGKYFLAVYNLLSIGLFSFSIYIFLKTFVRILSKEKCILLSLMLTLLFVAGAFDTGENWYWYSATGGAYLLNVILFILSLSKIVKKTNLYNLLLLIFIYVYIGFASEGFVLFVLWFLPLFIITLLKFDIIKKVDYLWQKIFILLLMMVICFIINISSPGSMNRHEALKHVGHNNLLTTLFVSNYLLYKKYVIVSLLKSLFISLPIAYIINYWIKNISIKLEQLLIYGLLLNVIIILYNFPIIFILHDIGGARVYLILSILIGIYSLFAGIYTINYIIKTGKVVLSKILSISFAFILFVCGFYYITIHYNYSMSYDRRISYLKSLKNTGSRQETIEIEVLPKSGLLRSGDISIDENNYDNNSLKNYIGLKKKLKIKKN